MYLSADTFLLAAPIIFMITEHAQIRWMAPEAADSLIQFLGRAWPVVIDQYQYVRDVKGPNAATNYAVYCAVFFAVTPMFVIYTLVGSAIYRRYIAAPEGKDVLVFFTFLFLFILVWFVDDVRPDDPGSLYNFHVDGIGRYYLRQWVAFSGAGISAMLLIFLFSLIPPTKILNKLKAK
jgi:hypothetical protein